MTALSVDMRELCSHEIQDVSGADAWGVVQGWGMIATGAVTAGVAAIATVPTAGVSAFAAAGGISLMIAGMYKVEEEK